MFKNIVNKIILWFRSFLNYPHLSKDDIQMFHQNKKVSKDTIEKLTEHRRDLFIICIALIILYLFIDNFLS